MKMKIVCEHIENGKLQYHTEDVGLTCHEYIAVCNLCGVDISELVENKLSWVGAFNLFQTLIANII